MTLNHIVLVALRRRSWTVTRANIFHKHHPVVPFSTKVKNIRRLSWTLAQSGQWEFWKTTYEILYFATNKCLFTDDTRTWIVCVYISYQNVKLKISGGKLSHYTLLFINNNYPIVELTQGFSFYVFSLILYCQGGGWFEYSHDDEVYFLITSGKTSDYLVHTTLLTILKSGWPSWFLMHTTWPTRLPCATQTSISFSSEQTFSCLRQKYLSIGDCQTFYKLFLEICFQFMIKSYQTLSNASTTSRKTVEQTFSLQMKNLNVKWIKYK